MHDTFHDILGEALVDFYNGDAAPLWIHNRYGDPEEMPIEIFFRESEDLTIIEKSAIAHCKGRVLDIGAGSGAMSLILQQDFDTTAIECSEGACQVMKALGVKNGIIGDVFDYQGEDYDTLLLLMNGIGIVGQLDNLEKSLSHFASMIVPDGQILLDSSDISYLYQADVRPEHEYYGQLTYRYEYKEKFGDWFQWLYVDFPTLKAHAYRAGLFAELLYEDDSDQYLARLIRK